MSKHAELSQVPRSRPALHCSWRPPRRWQHRPAPTVISTVGSGSSVGAISTPTATVVNHPPYGKVYPTN